MSLTLTDEERQALLRLIKEAPEALSRYPLSPEVETLRRVAEKLKDDERRKSSRQQG